MASELERRNKQNSTLQGRLADTRRKTSDPLKGKGSGNVNSAASRLALSGQAKKAAPKKRRSVTFSSPSEEWNRSGGPSILGRQGRPEQEEPIQGFLFSGAPTLEQFLQQASATSGGEAYASRIADAERRKAEALKGIGFGAEDLARGIEASRGTINGGYDTALQGTQEGLAAAQAAMLAQQKQTAERQAAEAQSLGLDVRSNPNADSDAAFANTVLTSQNNAAQDQLRSNQATQNTLNTAYAGAARGRGVEDQNTARRTYDSAIAELLDAQSAAQAESKSRAMQMYESARGDWQNERDFTYNEWVRNQENDRDDARWLLEQQMSNQPEPEELTPFERYMQGQAQAGVSSGTAQRWLNQATVGSRNKSPMEEWIGGGSTEARSNILAYLKSSGLL